jgi:hypothetical protein
VASVTDQKNLAEQIDEMMAVVASEEWQTNEVAWVSGAINIFMNANNSVLGIDADYLRAVKLYEQGLRGMAVVEALGGFVDKTES